MRVHEGLIPTILGTAVVATGTLLNRRNIKPMVTAGLIGFGLAHILLGAIDLVQDDNDF
jgi:hypothetical protein